MVQIKKLSGKKDVASISASALMKETQYIHEAKTHLEDKQDQKSLQTKTDRKNDENRSSALLTSVASSSSIDLPHTGPEGNRGDWTGPKGTGGREPDQSGT